jgi:integrase
LLAVTGLRISEALALRFEDITADSLVIRITKFHNYAAFLAMPNRLRLDHEDAGKEPAARHSQVDWIGIVLMGWFQD